MWFLLLCILVVLIIGVFGILVAIGQAERILTILLHMANEGEEDLDRLVKERRERRKN